MDSQDTTEKYQVDTGLRSAGWGGGGGVGVLVWVVVGVGV